VYEYTVSNAIFGTAERLRSRFLDESVSQHTKWLNAIITRISLYTPHCLRHNEQHKLCKRRSLPPGRIKAELRHVHLQLYADEDAFQI
jgi:hypothetical protein